MSDLHGPLRCGCALAIGTTLTAAARPSTERPSLTPASPARNDDKPGVVWFRRDLRLNDNPAWAAATAAHADVLAVFVIEPALMRSSGAIRRDQLLAHLGALDADLRASGGALVVRAGPASAAISNVLRECEGSALYFNTDAGPFSRARDQRVEAESAVPVHVFHGHTVHEPGQVLTLKGTLSQVFTPFYKTWLTTRPTIWPSSGEARVATLSGIEIPKPQHPPQQPAGEGAAWERLTQWNDRVDDYANNRDRPDIEGTSGLSADLKFGTIAARTVVDVVGRSTAGRESFVRQIAWRDWWAHTLGERPDLAQVAIKPSYDNIEWRDDPAGFDRWCTGTTGYPIVDAGMRQLVQTGWMHGRVRMLCASFLVKDLLIDWRKGEQFFRRHLIDADLAQNAGNWQWVAGTGPDAAPYFRIFNPTTQSQKFDPDGTFIRRWVPELSALPPAVIHEPERAGPLVLAAAGVTLGEQYPSPIVGHRDARARALEAYKRAV